VSKSNAAVLAEGPVAVRIELERLCAGCTVFPSPRDFHVVGVRDLYDALVVRGELKFWAREMGLPLLPTRGRGAARKWTEDNIRVALTELCAGRDWFPGGPEFRAAGLGGLYSRLCQWGELDRWAGEMRLPRHRADKWDDDSIRIALTKLCASRTSWPPQAEFEEAGLLGLYGSLSKRDELDRWAEEMGFVRPPRVDWNDETIRAALIEFCAGRKTWPTVREFVEAGLVGLYGAISERSELDRWAEEMGFGRRRHGAAWDNESVRVALVELCAGKDSFPTHPEFAAAGLTGLHTAIRDRGEFDRWAEEMGFGWRRRGASWDEDSIRAVLTEFCAGKGSFPTQRMFGAVGLTGLYCVIERRGELDRWAEEMGYGRRRRGASWDEDSIRAAMTEFCAGRDWFPSPREFKAAGLTGLYDTMYRRGELDRWAQEMGLEKQHRRWRAQSAMAHA
jgi:hypothetical protein